MRVNWSSAGGRGTKTDSNDVAIVNVAFARIRTIFVVDDTFISQRLIPVVAIAHNDWSSGAIELAVPRPVP